MSYNSRIIQNPVTLESEKFVEIVGDTRFPATSVVRVQYGESGMPPVTSVEVYPKYAVVTYMANTSDIVVSLSAGDVNIGNVGLIDQSTGTDVYAKITQTDTIGGAAVGAVSVQTQNFPQLDALTAKDFATNATVRSLTASTYTTRITNTAAISGSVTMLNPVTAFTLLNPTTGITVNAVVNTQYSDSASLDAFSRLRVSQPVTLFESKQLHQMSSLFWSNETLSGSVYHSGVTDSSIMLTVSGNNAYAIRQTTQRFNYQAGKSMLYMFTGILNPEADIIKRYGAFTSLTAAPYTPEVGLYFEAASGSMAVVQANNNNLVPSVYVPRSLWNIDQLSGNGPSGKTAVLSGTNIFVIDYEWLGVGRVRYGMVIDGQVCYCHAINNTGKAGTYTRTPNHPIRAEIRQTSAAPVSGSMKIICSTVIAEGGTDFSGVTRCVESGAYPGITIAAGARRAILGVRLQYNKLDSVNQVLNAGAICVNNSANSQSPFKYELVLNPTSIGAGTWTNIADSNFQYWNDSTTGVSLTGGTVLVNGFGSQGTGIDLNTFNLQKFLRLGCSISGKRDELYLVITPLATNDGVYGTLAFIESD